MKTVIKTNDPELRKQFLNELNDVYIFKEHKRTGKLLVSVGEQKQEGGEYIFEVEYV